MAVQTISLHMHTSHTRFSACTQAPLFAGSSPTKLIFTTHVATRIQINEMHWILCLSFMYTKGAQLHTNAESVNGLILPPSLSLWQLKLSRHLLIIRVERVKLMSQGGRKEGRRKTRAERKREREPLLGGGGGGELLSKTILILQWGNFVATFYFDTETCRREE